jgi:hypothetical protein
MWLLGNLDCERTWSRRPPLPASVGRRIAALATALRALSSAARVGLRTPVAFDPARIPHVPGLPEVYWLGRETPPDNRCLPWGSDDELAGTEPPQETELAGLAPAWTQVLAQPPATATIARVVNHRGFCARLRRQLECELPGETVVTSEQQLRQHLESGALPTASWVAKAMLTSAGRDRAHGTGSDERGLAQVRTLLRDTGEVVLEPWLERILDFGQCGVVSRDRQVWVDRPHELHSSPHGGFRGIRATPPELSSGEEARAHAIALAVGAALADAGYAGPFTVDGFVYRDARGHRSLHPLCEINARLSFGVVAKALCARLGYPHLRVGPNVPAGALVLVHPSRQDPSALWLERA